MFSSLTVFELFTAALREVPPNVAVPYRYEVVKACISAIVRFFITLLVDEAPQVFYFTVPFYLRKELARF